MENNFWGTISAIALAIVGTATVALIVSKNANTTGVIGATSAAFSNALGVALSPVTGTASASGSVSATSSMSIPPFVESITSGALALRSKITEA